MRQWQQSHIIITAATIPVALLVCWWVYKKTTRNNKHHREMPTANATEGSTRESNSVLEVESQLISVDRDLKLPGSDTESDTDKAEPANGLIAALDDGDISSIDQPKDYAVPPIPTSSIMNEADAEVDSKPEIQADILQTTMKVESNNLGQCSNKCIDVNQDSNDKDSVVPDVAESSLEIVELDNVMQNSSQESDHECQTVDATHKQFVEADMIASGMKNDQTESFQLSSDISISVQNDVCSHSPDELSSDTESNHQEEKLHPNDISPAITGDPVIVSDQVDLKAVHVNGTNEDTSQSSEGTNSEEKPQSDTCTNTSTSLTDENLHLAVNGGHMTDDSLDEQETIENLPDDASRDSDLNANNNNNNITDLKTNYAENGDVVIENEDIDEKESHQRSKSCETCNADGIKPPQVNHAKTNGWDNNHAEVECENGYGETKICKKRPSSLPPLGIPDKLNDNDDETMQVYVEFPSERVGLLIGKQGRNIKQLKQDSGADVFVHAVPFREDIQVLQICGTQSEVESCVSRIKRRFNDITLTPYDGSSLNIPSPTSSHMSPTHTPPPLMYPVPNISQLRLPEGIAVEVVVSAIAAVDCVFVQQYTHPTYHGLEGLERAMAMCYAEPSTPGLPNPVQVGLICAAPQQGMWYRAQIVQCFEDSEEILIKFMDYGGYATLPGNSIKQIRADLVTLPFQAVECYLDNIAPPEDNQFCEETVKKIAEMLKEGRFQARVTGYRSDGHPRIHLIKCLNNKGILINQEMATKGLATWIEPAPFQSI